MPEIGSPQAKTYEDGGRQEISVAGLAGQVVFVPYNGKIADINEDNTNYHYLALDTPLSEMRTILAIFLGCARISGTGVLTGYPNEGATSGVNALNDRMWVIVIASGTQRLMYRQSVANDDFDLYCFGYVVVGG